MEGAQNLMPISSQAELVNILVCIEIRQKCERVVMSCQFQSEREIIFPSAISCILMHLK